MNSSEYSVDFEIKMISYVTLGNDEYAPVWSSRASRSRAAARRAPGGSQRTCDVGLLASRVSAVRLTVHEFSCAGGAAAEGLASWLGDWERAPALQVALGDRRWSRRGSCFDELDTERPRRPRSLPRRVGWPRRRGRRGRLEAQ
jgi:hypothetical protein